MHFSLQIRFVAFNYSKLVSAIFMELQLPIWRQIKKGIEKI